MEVFYTTGGSGSAIVTLDAQSAQLTEREMLDVAASPDGQWLVLADFREAPQLHAPPTGFACTIAADSIAWALWDPSSSSFFFGTGEIRQRASWYLGLGEAAPAGEVMHSYLVSDRWPEWLL